MACVPPGERQPPDGCRKLPPPPPAAPTKRFEKPKRLQLSEDAGETGGTRNQPAGGSPYADPSRPVQLGRATSRLSKSSLKTQQSGRSVGTARTAISHHVTQAVEPAGSYFRRLFKEHQRLLVASLLLLGLGVTMGMVLEKYSFLTALYLIVAMTTTIGYGDVPIERDLTRMFLAIYGLLLLVVVANFLNVLIGAIVEKNTQVVHDRLKKFEDAARGMMSDGPTKSGHGPFRNFGRYSEVMVPAVFFLCVVTTGTVFFRLVEGCTCSYDETRTMYNLLECDGSTYETCVATGGLTFTWLRAFYMSVITATTIGFGDFSPKSQVGRAFGMVWMVLSVATTGLFLSAVTKVISPEDELQTVAAAEMSRKLFDQMDMDGSGYLTKAEYARWTLVSSGIIPMDILEEIDAKYDLMDPGKTGRVTWEMVQRAAILQTEEENATSQAEAAGGPGVEIIL